jgi:hypothetical protein
MPATFRTPLSSIFRETVILRIVDTLRMLKLDVDD